MHLSKERVDSIINLSESSNKRLVLNNEYVCYFISPDPDSKDSKFFSSWERDTNCPRESCYAFAKVYSTVKMSTTYGMVFVANDKDLSCEHSIMLCLLDSKKPMAFNDLFEVKESGGWTSMVTVTGVHDTVMPMKFRDFMKFIKYKPERNPNEPEESLGLGVATFDCPNKQYAGIEYSITGSAYYEAID